MARLESSADVVVVGAGVVGAACAYYAAKAGLRVVVLDRGAVAGGTSSRGEGNLLISDKAPGSELNLTLRSLQLWHELGSALGDAFELESKGGLVVAASAEGLAALKDLAAAQRESGVEAVSDVDLQEYEPHLRDGLAGGVYYPQDLQVQPMLAAAQLLRAARHRGATVHPGTTVTAIDRESPGGAGALAIRTTAGVISTPAVVNAAGTWAGEVAALAGVAVPVRPRRGFILVTEPVPVLSAG